MSRIVRPASGGSGTRGGSASGRAATAARPGVGGPSAPDTAEAAAGVGVAASAIRATARRIPPGCVVTYGQLAALAGYPGRARLAGRSLSTPEGEAPVPWFRVLGAPGRIAFAEGSEAFDTQ